MFAHSLPVSIFSLDKAFRISQINDVAAYAVAILGLNLVIGYSGQLSLGQSAFVGLGAYTTIILVADYNWSYFATIPVSAGLCFVVGMIVGLPALRIRGLYLAIVTLAVAYVFPTLVLKFESLTGGPNGKKPDRGEAVLNPPSWMPFADDGRIAGPLWVFCILAVMTAVLFLLARNYIKSRPGRALIAVRDNQTSASVSGVNLPLYKSMAFGVSAAFGGLAGTMLMMNRPFASDVQFGLQLAIFLVVGLVAGGAGTISGAIPGRSSTSSCRGSWRSGRSTSRACRPACVRSPSRCSTGSRTARAATRSPGSSSVSACSRSSSSSRAASSQACASCAPGSSRSSRTRRGSATSRRRRARWSRSSSPPTRRRRTSLT